jgi:stage III sporulation protein AG
MTGRTTGSINGNGDNMQKTSRKTHTILLGTIVLLVIIFINSSLDVIGGEKGKKEESGEFVALQEALMKIEGIGEVSLYFHYEDGASADPLSDYFSMSTASAKKGSELKGILVVAEGAEDFKIKNELSKILSTVLQLPEHRIAIVEMKKRGNTNENE